MPTTREKLAENKRRMEDNKKVLFSVMQVRKFAARKRLPDKEAFRYLKQFGGIHFLDECYDVEHTLSDEIVFEDLDAITRKNGGQQ